MLNSVEHYFYFLCQTERMNKQRNTNATLSLIVLGLIAGIQGAGPNISSTALVGASRGLDMVGGTQALAASMQTLAIAATVISTGLLADRLGRRRVLVASLIVGALGNLVIMLSPVASLYIVGEALTGIGLGAAFAAAFATIKVIAPPEKLAAAMGTFSAASGVFTIIFTFVGGTLASANWRIAFVLLPVASLVTVFLVFATLPDMPALPATRHSVIGQVLLALGLVSLLYGVSHLASSLTSAMTLVPIGLGVLLLTGFAVSQRRSSIPFFPIDLFKKPLFLAAITAGFIYNFGNAVAFLQMTNLWQYIIGLNTSQVSLWQLPLLFTGIIAAVIFGRLMSRGLSAQAALLTGALLSAAGFVALFFARSATDFLAFLPGGILIGAGVIVASLPYGTLILSQAPERFYGPVTSSRTTFGQLFYSFGIAISTVVIDQLTRGGVTAKLTAAGVPADQIGTGLSAVSAYASEGTKPSTSLGQQALASAATSYTDAFGSMMLITGVLTVIAGIAGFMLIRHATKRDPL